MVIDGHEIYGKANDIDNNVSSDNDAAAPSAKGDPVRNDKDDASRNTEDDATHDTDGDAARIGVCDTPRNAGIDTRELTRDADDDASRDTARTTVSDAKAAAACNTVRRAKRDANGNADRKSRRLFLDFVDMKEGSWPVFVFRSASVFIIYVTGEKYRMIGSKEKGDTLRGNDEDHEAWTRFVSWITAGPRYLLSNFYTKDPFDETNKESEDEKRYELILLFQR
ncbi:unnamed protein product [Peronospora effusa]|uniref:Uncharacterized protein n=1 Tax=Peronospora effusa TaxID=542832 RepID=A0A3R7W0F5_9STRA|nr:hypothetical protein DD237_008321 [Peronospora effusa]CAI5717412.1 unnamed protein product [Peronospora effusa]